MVVPFSVQLLVVVVVIGFSVLLGNLLARRFRMPDHGWKMSLIMLTIGLGLVITVLGWPLSVVSTCGVV